MADAAAPKPTLTQTIARFTPDARIWVMLGLFLLSYKLLNMVEHLPSLLNSAPFMTMATLVLGGSGLGAVVSFLFGGTKTGADVMKTQSDALAGATPDTEKTTTTTAITKPPATDPLALKEPI